MTKKSLIVFALVVAFMLAFSSMAYAEFVKGFDKNLELYPDWIGLDAQGLPTTMPIFNNSTTGYINEIVWVEVPCDTDRDGKRDRISLWIRRPVTADGFLCPVVMEFSPYHNGTVGYSRMSSYANSTDLLLKGMSESFTYKPNNDVHLSANPDTTDLTYDDIRYKGIEAWDPIWWSTQGAFSTGSWYTGTDYSDTLTYTDEYGDVRTRKLYTGTVPPATVPTGVGTASSTGAWGGSQGWPARWNHYLVRGYAGIFGQLLGNRGVEGITNSLHVEEWLSAAAACKWLKGEAKAFTTRDGTIEVLATWANGHVALDGTSYPGTTPTVAAMAGVKGVKVIMPEAHVASWYEYYRSGGALHGPEGYGGEDMNLHSSFNFSRINSDSTSGAPPNGPLFTRTAQEAYVETQHYMMTEQDRDTADYNAAWDFRNLTRAYGKIADDVGILQTNGQQDWNVMPRHAYQALQSFRDNFGGVHKIVSTLTTHASQTGRLVMGTDGVQRGMLKWYLMFLDHFMLGLDNHVDELMYDVNIANNKTGVIEGYNYDTEKEQRGTILPGATYQKIYLTPGPAETTAGRFSYNQPETKVEGFADMNVTQQLSYLPRHPGAPTNISPVITDRNNAGTSSNGQGNETPTTNQINYCDDRVVGINRTTTTYTPYTSLIECIDRPVAGRLMYISEPLTEDLRLSGTTVVHLNGAPTKATGNLTVALLSIGRIPYVAARTGSSVSSSGATSVTVFPTENGATSVTASTYGQTNGRVGTSTNNFKYVTWGHTDIQNPSTDGKAWFQVPEHNYTPNYYFQTTAIVPGQFYNYVVEMNPYNFVFEAGNRIAVMVYGTDALASPNLDAESTGGLDIMLGAGSYIDIPLMLAEPQEAVTIEAASASVALGDNVDIAYGVKDNTFGFTALDVELPFDSSIYTPVTVTPAALLGEADFAFETVGNTLKVTIAAQDNIVGDGALFTVTYKIKESAPYIFTTPLNVVVKDAKFGSFMDKTVDLDMQVSAGKISTKLVSLVPVASVKKLNGNKNDLTITVTETYEDGKVQSFTKTFSINNNAADTYALGPYKVYVDTKGNDQIRECKIVR